MMGETNLKACVLMSIFLLTLGCTTASARTIYVDDNGPADFNTIQAAIDDSNDGDMIIVKPGLYLEYIEFLGKNITVTSTRPSDFNLVSSTSIDYGVVFAGTEDPNCMLMGFNINSSIIGQGTHATISHCLLIHNRVGQGTVIKNCDGTITNCIVAYNFHLGDWWGPAVSECHGLIKNCTIVQNSGIGIEVLQGTTTIENCIIYYSYMGVRVGGTVNVLYSNVDKFHGGGNVNRGPGNINTDPCLVRIGDLFGGFDGDYHLQSQSGRWDPNSQSWVQDANTSQCIDAGNPHSPIGLEPFPNGGRINMGAYGGTPEASKSYFGQPVCETIIAGDINGDCRINFLDFQLLALHWLGGKQYIPNEPPVVSITWPPDGAGTYYGFIIGIEADASDDDGVVVKVEFFANGNKIGEDSNGTDGWKTDWQDHPIGVYNLTAKATDNDGAETTSTPVEITLNEGEPP